jgi:hypothetical protein
MYHDIFFYHGLEVLLMLNVVFFISNQKNYFTFKFKIKLHIDDLNVLNNIKDPLGVGKVIFKKRGI